MYGIALAMAFFAFAEAHLLPLDCTMCLSAWALTVATSRALTRHGWSNREHRKAISNKQHICLYIYIYIYIYISICIAFGPIFLSGL